MGKVIDNAVLGACQRDLQEYLIAITPEDERATLRKRFCEQELEEAASRMA
jgi:hypothetical protein